MQLTGDNYMLSDCVSLGYLIFGLLTQSMCLTIQDKVPLAVALKDININATDI